MKNDVAPQRVDVLRHYVHLRTFKYAKTTASDDLYHELHHTIVLCERASIPVTKSKQRKIIQIKERKKQKKELYKNF